MSQRCGEYSLESDNNHLSKESDANKIIGDGKYLGDVTPTHKNFILTFYVIIFYPSICTYFNSRD